MKAKLEGEGVRGTLALLGGGKKGVLEVLKQTDIAPFAFSIFYRLSGRIKNNLKWCNIRLL